jgi:hypothetical protein
MSLFEYIKGISPDQYSVHAHCKRTNIVKISPHSCQKSSVVRESSWVKQLNVDKILSPTSLKVSGFLSGKFSDNLSELFSEYLMHILTKKSGKICINFENIFWVA